MGGACCVGSTSAAPTALGECETWSVGLAAVGEARLARWDSGGAVVTDSLEERALVAIGGAGWRWSRRGHVTGELPLRLSSRAAGDLQESGVGPGDARITAAFDPFEERPGALPPPVFRAGLRLPTGRSWDESASPLQADVTGLPGAALAGGVSLERAVGRTPWSVGVSGEAPLDPGAHPALVAAAGSVGRYLGTDWTASASLRHERTFALAAAGQPSTARTTAGARLIRGRRMAWRGWVGGAVDLPLAGLGLESGVYASATAGAVVVR